MITLQIENEKDLAECMLALSKILRYNKHIESYNHLVELLQMPNSWKLAFRLENKKAVEILEKLENEREENEKSIELSKKIKKELTEKKYYGNGGSEISITEMRKGAN